MSVARRLVVVLLVVHVAVAAHAEDGDVPPGAQPQAETATGEATQLEAGVVDTYGGIAFGARVIGLPALFLGGTCMGTGLHALAVAGALNASQLGIAGYWTEFGGLIALGVSALPIIVGEIAMGTGAFTDLLTGMDLTAAEADGSGLAFARLATWELAAHSAGLGGGLAIGGILSIITTIVMPSIFAFDARGDAAYNDLFTLGLTTTVIGLVVALIAATLAGTSFWLDGATTDAYKKAAAGKTSAARRETDGDVTRTAALPVAPAMAY